MHARFLVSPALRSGTKIASAKALLAAMALVGTTLTLAACSSNAPVPPPATTEATGPDTCGATQFQPALGKLLDVVLLQNITDAVTSHRVLVMRPDTVATTDVVPERAIIKTDKTNMILSITCG
jgi:hypothetical protein